MAFPAIASTGTTNGTSASATPVLNLPSGIQQNDLLLGYFRSAVAGAVTWPTGWTELVDASPDGADDQVSIAWKRAEGTETGTITLASGSGRFVGVIRRITGAADPLVRPPEISTVATGTSPNQPDAGTASPTGGAKDYLWDTVYFMEGEQTGITSYPANYTHAQSGFLTSGTAGAVTSNVTMGVAGRQLNAASENAGAWGIAGTLDDWSAYTVAVHPPDAAPELAWAPSIDPAAVVRSPAAPIVAISMVFAAVLPATADQAVGQLSDTLWKPPTLTYQDVAGPVSAGSGTPWNQQPPQPTLRAAAAPPGGSTIFLFVEEAPAVPSVAAWDTRPILVRALPQAPSSLSLLSSDTAGFNQELAWTAHGEAPPRPALRLTPGPFYGDPTTTAALTQVAGGHQSLETLWGQPLVHVQQAAGPVVVVNVTVPELSWWPRFPGVLYRTPPAREFGVFPLRPLGDELVTGPYAPTDDSVVRAPGPFGYQAWAGPISNADPAFLSDLPWIARLDPPVRRPPLPKVSVARPLEPPASVVHPVWQSQAAAFQVIRRPATPQIDHDPAHIISFEQTFTQLGWIPPLHEIVRRRPDPWVVTARSLFPLDAAATSNLPWLPPPLTFRRPPQPWAPTPAQPWDPPVTVSDRAWLAPYQAVIRRIPPAPWGFALPPFPLNAASTSDLPWLQIPDPIRRARWTPPDPWGFVNRPPDIPTYFPGQITQPVRRLVAARGPFAALPTIPSGGILWWPAPPVLEQPAAPEGPPLWIPTWSLLIVGDQWCIQLSDELALVPVLQEEIGIQASLINEIGLTASLAAEEEC